MPRNFDLMHKEIDRIVDETLMDVKEPEKSFIVSLTIGLFLRSPISLPAKYLRIVHEILHKYYCMKEGLEKK